MASIFESYPSNSSGSKEESKTVSDCGISIGDCLWPAQSSYFVGQKLGAALFVYPHCHSVGVKIRHILVQHTYAHMHTHTHSHAYMNARTRACAREHTTFWKYRFYRLCNDFQLIHTLVHIDQHISNYIRTWSFLIWILLRKCLLLVNILDTAFKNKNTMA